jgi:predicted amidohydrolase/regulation of enolase protein 1 (concanavalin A-like superfamily)
MKPKVIALPRPLSCMPQPPFVLSRCGRHVAILAFLIFFAGIAASAQELMPPTTDGWSGFAARTESTPGLLASSGSPYTLQILGNGIPNVYGGWRAHLQGLTGGSYYRFRARVIAQDIPPARESVTILLRWRGSYGDEVSPDYVWEFRTQPDGSLSYDRTLQAPAGTTAVDVELILQWAPNGRVQFDALSLVATDPPASRPVKVAAVSYRPSGTSSGLESVQRAEAYGEQVAATNRPDVMVFGELLNVIGAPGSYDAKAESIPGPSTDTMASLARAYRTYVAFGMLERDDRFLYNAAVLLDRNGDIVGKYRKMQVPLPEVSSGITPGSDVPVFQTDFGRVALLICQDTAFPEPARQAAIREAEMLLVPIWGGKAPVVAARAIEQSMYVVASGYDYNSEVLDPLGSVLARVASPGQRGAAVATVDLAHRFREKWIGDWRDLAGKQRRTYTPLEWTPGTGSGDPLPGNVPPTVALTAPSGGAHFVAPATITVSASAADSDGAVTQVEFYAGATLLATDASSPYGLTWRDVPAGSYTLIARATDTAGAVTASSPVSITVSDPASSSLPAPWSSQDIGAVGVAGNASGSDGRFTVQGSGADIWGSSDAFRFVYQPLTGDGTIVALVSALSNTDVWTKAGVMIRASLAAGSAHAIMAVSAAKGLAFQRRPSAGGTSISTSGSAAAAPWWLKISRRGNSITASSSANGTNWTVVGTDTIPMPAQVFIGLALTSHDNSALATATFDAVSVTAGSGSLPAGWTYTDVGAVGAAGSGSESGGTFTVKGAGADTWDTSDAFGYAATTLTGNGQITARVASVQNVSTWTKAGVMVRDGLTAGAAHAFMIQTPTTIKGTAFQRRAVANAATTSGAGPAVAPPYWVRLARSGNTFTASVSPNGTTWTVVGADTIAMGATVDVGLAVSSHVAASLATATFDNVTITPSP